MKILELLKMSLTALRVNMLRSFLTLVGIIAGVASIIAVMTGISVIQNTMEKEMSVLGSTVFQVQKWHHGGPLSEEERRKIAQRRPTTVENANAIREKSKLVTLVGPELWDFGHTIAYKDKKMENTITFCGGSPEYAPNNTHLVAEGRNLNNFDLDNARKVVVIGYSIAETIFPYIDPIGKVVKLDGHKFTVVGVFEDKQSSMGGGYNNYCLIPITTFQKMMGSRTRWGGERSVNITVRAKSPEVVNEAIEEVRGILRAERNVNARDDDDFTIFNNESSIRNFNEATGPVKAGAFVIGIIALVVAGIGIMNIMLVSVTERTREIGIRKALGARRESILKQFLLEAIILCNVGGVFGVIAGFALGNVMTIFTGFPAHVPMEWAVGGLLFCTTVGVVFGMWPAVVASKLDPIESLRYE